MMTTDWSRAVLKLWVASLVIWVAVVAVFALNDPHVPSLSRSCDLLLEGMEGAAKTSRMAQAAECRLEWEQQRFYLLGWALLPPMAAGGILLFLLWAMRGSRAGPGNW